MVAAAFPTMSTPQFHRLLTGASDMGASDLHLTVGRPPVISADAAGSADPLPQALVLTAIVIGFAMTAFAIVLALKAKAELGTDRVDGGEAP